MNSTHPGALKANRQGRLDSGQIRLFTIPILIAVIWILMASGVVFSGITLWTGRKEIGWGGILGTIILLIVALSFLWMAVMIGGNQVADLFTGKVAHVDGLGRKQFSTGFRAVAIRRYFVNDKILVVSDKKTFESLPVNQPVRAYYALRSKTLVNIETIDPT
jgi:hypothetical protein